MKEPLESFAFSRIEFFAALVEYLERDRGIKLNITDDSQIHWKMYRGEGNDFTCSLWVAPRPPEKPKRSWFSRPKGSRP